MRRKRPLCMQCQRINPAVCVCMCNVQKIIVLFYCTFPKWISLLRWCVFRLLHASLSKRLFVIMRNFYRKQRTITFSNIVRLCRWNRFPALIFARTISKSWLHFAFCPGIQSNQKCTLENFKYRWTGITSNVPYLHSFLACLFNLRNFPVLHFVLPSKKRKSGKKCVREQIHRVDETQKNSVVENGWKKHTQRIRRIVRFLFSFVCICIPLNKWNIRISKDLVSFNLNATYVDIVL